MSIWEEQLYGTDPSAAEDWSNFEFVSGVLNTPRKVSAYLADHLAFIWDDPSNPNYTAGETFQRGGGDCEDLAAFAVHSLRRAGVSSSVLDVQWGNLDATEALGHAVALYSDGQSYWYVDTGLYSHGRIVGPFQSVTEAANSVNPSWLRWSRLSETFGVEEEVYK